MPRIKGLRKIGRYTDEFKVKAVRLTMLKGTQVQEVGNALDIHPFMLSRWRKEYREGKYVADRRIKADAGDNAPCFLILSWPAPGSLACNMAAETLRRVGCALIAVGLADMGLMVYCIMNELSYSSSLNIFAVIAGVFLLRQSTKAASIVSFFAAFMLGGLGLAAVLIPLLMPFDLLATQFRLKPAGSALTVLLAVAFLAFAFWVCRTLTSPAVMEARRAAGVNARKPVTAFVIGVLLAVGLSVIMVLVTRGSSAESAIAKAKEKTGPGYKYYVTSMHWSGGSGSATITAYNSAEIKEVKVEW